MDDTLNSTQLHVQIREACPCSLDSPHLPRMALTLACKAFPCADVPPTAQKPVMPSALRACCSATLHFFNALCANIRLPRAEAALLTILPDLLFIRVAFVRPPTVFAFLPLKTAALANLPLAMTLTFLTFIAFLAAFIAGFMAAFMAAFMAFPLAAFIAGAMTRQDARQHERSNERVL